jgi:hypothetical protein
MRSLGELEAKQACLLAYFAGLFVFEISWGAASIQLYGYAASIMVCILVFMIERKICLKQIILFSLFIGIFYIYLPVNPMPIGQQIKYLLYLLPVAILPWIFDSHRFSRSYVNVCCFFLIFFLILFIVGVGHSTTYGMPRMQGLMSEPSALSILLSTVFLLAFYKKSIYLLLAVVAAFFAAASSMSVAVVLSSFAFYILLNMRSRAQRLAVIGVGLLTALLSVSFILSMELNGFIFGRLVSGIKSVLTLGEEGYNPRMTAALAMIRVTSDLGASLIYGMGLNAAGVMDELGVVRALSLPFEVYVSFGLLGLALYVLSLLWVLCFYRSADSYFKIAFSSVASYVLLNSAQGIVFQTLYFILFIYAMRRARVNCVLMNSDATINIRNGMKACKGRLRDIPISKKCYS